MTPSGKGSGFHDPFDDLLHAANDMSDEDLERVLSGQPAPSRPEEEHESMEPGTPVVGTVVDVRGGEVLVELGSKSIGLVDSAEFEGEFPQVGDEIRATFERFDASRDLCILSVEGVRRDLRWDELRPGIVTEGIVESVNKGGLTLNVKGMRAFMPISQIERSRVEDLEPYVGSKLRCEVTSVDRERQDVIVSRRLVLDREAEVQRDHVFDTLTEGQIIAGKIARLTDHGAFVDLGGFDGLLPAHKIRQQGKATQGDGALREGQRLEVQIVRIDRDKMRVSLDFKPASTVAEGVLPEDYAVGDEVTGWVSALADDGVILSVEEGVSGLLPEATLHRLPEPARPGMILKAVISSIDTERKLLILRPR